MRSFFTTGLEFGARYSHPERTCKAANASESMGAPMPMIKQGVTNKLRPLAFPIKNSLSLSRCISLHKLWSQFMPLRINSGYQIIHIFDFAMVISQFPFQIGRKIFNQICIWRIWAQDGLFMSMLFILFFKIVALCTCALSSMFTGSSTPWLLKLFKKGLTDF